MSRVGRRATIVPQGVTVAVNEGVLVVKGPKGEISKKLPAEINIDIEGDKALVKHTNSETKEGRALWGTFSSHLTNMVKGVVDGYEKKLLISGVGYNAVVQGDKLTLNVGFSHPIVMDIPKGLKVETKKGEITITGHDKESVGQFASKIRLKRKVEPYKGHGIYYSDEYVIRKQGKKAAT